MKYMISLILAVLLTGCATSIEKQSASLQEANSCCTSLNELPFKPLVLSQKIKLDQTANVFDFAKGRSYFAAYELPEGGARKFRIKSFFNGMFIGQYLDPVILVLDESRQEIAIGTLEMKFFEAGPSWDGEAHMLGEFVLDQRARYLVLLTSKFDSMAPVAITKPTGYGYMIGSTPIVAVAPSQSIQLKRSPTGTLLLEAVH